jgi:hypothetical protein
MKKLKANQQGFVPMLVTILGVILAVIVFTYLRVAHASQ